MDTIGKQRARLLLVVAASVVTVLLVSAARALSGPLAGSPGAADVSLARVEPGPVARIFHAPHDDMDAAAALAAYVRGEGMRGAEMNNFGDAPDPLWFVMPLRNPGPAPVERLLVFDPSWLDDIRVTLATADGFSPEQRGGDHYGFDGRPLPDRKAHFLLLIPPGDSRLLVRVQTSGPCVVGMTLWERSAFFSAENYESAYVGAVYGVFGAMLLFNVVLWLTVRDRVYGAYVAYLLAFMVVYAAYNGYLYQYLWPRSPRFADWINSTFIYLYAAAGLHFALRFLDLRTRLPGLDLLGRLMLAAIFASLLVSSLVGWFEWSDGGLAWVIACSTFTLLLGAVALASGVQAARYYVPASASGFIGATITALTVSGHLHFTFLTYHAAELGMLVDAMLLSFALAERLRLAQAAVEEARRKLLDAARVQAQQLEREVEQRTRELRASNAAKDRFVSILAHDLRGPVRSLGLLFSDVISSPRDFTDEMLQLTRESTRNTGELLEQLLVWARSQRGEIKYDPHIVELAELMGETERLFAAQAEARGISLALKLQAPCPVFADAPMVKTILRNLVANALKFTPDGGRIESRVSTAGTLCAIGIADNGAGMGPDELRQLLPGEESPSVNSSSGLGLIICREFVERHGGSLSVQSRPGEGSVFTFTLPRAAANAACRASAAVADA